MLERSLNQNIHPKFSNKQEQTGLDNLVVYTMNDGCSSSFSDWGTDQLFHCFVWAWLLGLLTTIGLEWNSFTIKWKIKHTI